MENVEKMRFKIHNFASLEEASNECILTTTIQAHGYPWNLQICPRGHRISSKDAEYISIFLLYAGDSEEKPAATFSFRCNAYKQMTTEIHTFEGTNQHWGCADYLKRKDVLEKYLDEDGTLVIDVDIQIAVEKEDAWKDVWYPAV